MGKAPVTAQPCLALAYPNGRMVAFSPTRMACSSQAYLGLPAGRHGHRSSLSPVLELMGVGQAKATNSLASECLPPTPQKQARIITVTKTRHCHHPKSVQCLAGRYNALKNCSVPMPGRSIAQPECPRLKVTQPLATPQHNSLLPLFTTRGRATDACSAQDHSIKHLGLIFPKIHASLETTITFQNCKKF